MVSRAGLESRLSSIICYGSLPPVVLCVLYSAFVMPLFDYCDVVWCPTTAKLTSLVERAHSKFLHKLPSSVGSKINSTLTERCRFHTAVQVFRSLYSTQTLSFLSPQYVSVFKRCDRSS